MSLSQDLLRLALRPVQWAPGGTTRASIDMVSPKPRHQRPAPPPRSLQRLAVIERHEVAGRPVLSVTPRHDPTGHQVLFWHGGGWSLGMSRLHWENVRLLAQRTGATFWVPDYALAPRSTLQDTLPLVDALNALLPERAEAAGRGRRVIIGGDSAGGQLSLVSALRALELGQRPADHLLLYSPGLDLRGINPDMPPLERADPILRVEAVRAAGRAWAGARGVADALVSPPLAGPDVLGSLPPLDLFIGEADILLPDALIFAQRVREAGGTITLTRQPGGFHDYSLALITPEARRDLARSAQAILGRA